jgi:hypothetical protein
MSIIYPVEGNTPLQPPPPWLNGTTATAQLANTGEMVQYSTTGVFVAPGTTTSVTKDIITDPSLEAQLALIVNITAVTGGDTLTVQINGKNKDGVVYPILTSTALAAVATTPLRVGTGFTAVANLSANDMLPADIQVVCTVAGTGTIAYGIDLIIG